MNLPLFDLTGRTAIVTGGGRGIGKGICLALAQAGANVVVANRDKKSAAVYDAHRKVVIMDSALVYANRIVIRDMLEQAKAYSKQY